MCVWPSVVNQAKLGGILVPNLVQGSPLGLYSIDYYSELCTAIGAKANLYCEAIELVCGGSPKICIDKPHGIDLTSWYSIGTYVREGRVLPVCGFFF